MAGRLPDGGFPEGDGHRQRPDGRVAPRPGHGHGGMPALRDPGTRRRRPRPPPVRAGPRLGVFICTCNGTMASRRPWNGIRDMGGRLPGVVHSELIVSACHPARRRAASPTPSGSSRLGRVILASCVCCPLEFQCISCNDQRNRARIHLFDELGLDRSRFEMINLRDHLGGRDVSDEQTVAAGRRISSGRPSSGRRFLGPLRGGTTEDRQPDPHPGRLGGGRELRAQSSTCRDSTCASSTGAGCKDGPELPRGHRRAARQRAPSGKDIIHIARPMIEEHQRHLGNFQVTVWREREAASVAGRHRLPDRPEPPAPGDPRGHVRPQEILPVQLRLLPHPADRASTGSCPGP